MFRNLFYKPSEVEEKHVYFSSQPEAVSATTRDAILETQVENTFDLIEENIDKVMKEAFVEGSNQEERIEFLYQLLGTIIVEKNSDHFQRKIDIDIKLKECRYRLEKLKTLSKPEETLADKLNSVITTLEDIQRSKVEIDQKNGETIKNIRKILVVLTPKTETSPKIEDSPKNITYTKQVESNVLHKLKTFQSFWTTIRNNLHTTLSDDIKDSAKHVLETLNTEITVKLKEFQTADKEEPDKEEPKDEPHVENKDPRKSLTFETLQIAKSIINLRDKVKILLEDIENSDSTKYEKLRKTLDKCQDKFEDIESHTNPEIVTLRTETFDLLLKASRILNERYA